MSTGEERRETQKTNVNKEETKWNKQTEIEKSKQKNARW
jgi:hypothetical protein